MIIDKLQAEISNLRKEALKAFENKEPNRARDIGVEIKRKENQLREEIFSRKAWK